MNINIIVGRFQPLTKGHLKCAQYAASKYHVRTVLCMIETKKTDSKKPFLTSDFIDLYKSLLLDDKDIIDIILINNADIVKIKEICENLGYNIKYWTCGTDRFADYDRMAQKYAPEIEVIEVPRTDEDISATKARKALMDGDEYEFYKLFIPITIKQRQQFGNIFNTFKEKL